MNPPPMEKNVRSERTAPAASNAVKRSAVRMACSRAGRKHLVAVKDQVARLIEFDSAPAGKLDAPGGANCSNCGLNRRGIDGGWLIAGEAEKDRAIGSVAEAGESQRAV